jgi:hypothetical protein
MGEAKRRREQFRKTPPPCVFCGAIATTRDHVPPKNLFLPPRPLLITVPACETCNGSLSQLEDEFRVFVSAKIGPDTPEWLEFWKKGALTAVQNNSRLRRNIISGMGLLTRTPYGYGRTYKWPRESHDKVIEKITRGLYYHHFRETLASMVPIEITNIDSLRLNPNIDILNWLQQTINELPQHNVGGIEKFAYAFGRVPENPKLSMWIYQFYRRHWAAAITGDLDATER